MYSTVHTFFPAKIKSNVRVVNNMWEQNFTPFLFSVIWVVGVYTYRVASYKCFFGMQIFHHIKCSPLEFKISILCRVYGEIRVIQFTSSILLLKWMHVLLYNHYWKMTKCLYIRIWNIQGAWLTGGKRAWLTGGKKNDMSATHFSA